MLLSENRSDLTFWAFAFCFALLCSALLCFALRCCALLRFASDLLCFALLSLTLLCVIVERCWGSRNGLGEPPGGNWGNLARSTTYEQLPRGATPPGRCSEMVLRARYPQLPPRGSPKVFPN